MKKIGACISALLIFLTISVIAQDSDFRPGQGKVTATTLNVRHIPSTSGNIIDSLKRGDVVDIIEKSKYTSNVDGVNDYWYKVSLPKKKTGWIFGQYVSFELNTESGIRWKSTTPDSSQTFTSIEITESGMLIAGTHSGNIFLSNDNGKTFRKILPQALGVSVGRINSIYSVKGTIWIAATGDSNGGVWKSTNNGSSWVQITTSQGLPSNEVYDIVEASGTLYAATQKGLCISSDNGISFTEEKNVNMQVNSLAVSANNTIVAATSNGLYIATDKKGDTKKNWDRIKSKTTNMGDTVYTVAISPTNDIYIGTDKGLAKSSLSNLDQWVSIGGKVEINSILVDQNGRVLLGTNNGLNISLDQGGFWDTYKEENGLASNWVYRVAVNPVSGVIWIASLGSGLSYSD